MKFKLPMSVCVLISIALVIFGLTFGTMSGFHDERREVEGLLENGLMDALDYRAADGLNLCVVARRHLPQDDADLLALESAARQLMAPGESLPTKRAQDEALTAATTAVAQKLRQSDSFAASERDQKYLDMLSADLKNLAASDVAGTYNQAAQAFNSQLDSSLWGKLAGVLGVKRCELYQ